MYFNADHLPEPSDEYVAWFDVMGIQASMARSIQVTANFVFKLHIAALESASPTISLYPVMDGVYASCSEQLAFLSFLRGVFHKVADCFIETNEERFRFVVRGGIAFGPVYHGRDVGPDASHTLTNNESYRRAILLGMPMVQAHSTEREAPPFGLFVHESARTFAPNGSHPLQGAWWHWKNHSTETTWQNLKPKVRDYLAWCRERSGALQYPVDRIDVHEAKYEQLCALAG